MEQLSRGDGLGLNVLPNGDVVNENGDFIKKDGVYLDSPPFNNEIIPMERIDQSFYNGSFITEEEAADEVFIKSMETQFKSEPEVDDFDVSGNKEPTLGENIAEFGSKLKDKLNENEALLDNIEKDTAIGVIQGADAGLKNTLYAPGDIIGAGVDFVNDKIVKPVLNEFGIEGSDRPFMGSEMNTEAMDKITSFINDITPNFLKEPINEFADQPFTFETYGNLVKGFSQFGIVAIPAAQIVGYMSSANSLVRAVAWSGISDFTAMNPDDPAIAKVLLDYFEVNQDKLEPWATNAIAVLGKHDTDGRITKRLKNFQEGVIVGAFADTAMLLIRGVLKASVNIPWKGLTPLIAGTAATTNSNDAEASLFGTVIKASTKNADLGIKFSPEIGENNLRLHLKRIAEAKEKNIKYPGSPKNQRTVITNSDKTMPDIVVGDITFDDWKNRVEFLMNKEEILKASKWYGEVFTQFEKASGGNETEMKKLGEAWLSAQQNETPSSALTNVLSIFEQFKRGVPIDNIKGKGLPSANKIATDIIFGKEVTGGAGQKISDFIDSGHGKDVRSIMNNNSDGGAPFVVDVHTGRDTGLVDQEFINHLKRLGYDVPDNLIKDHAGGGIKGTMYENRALFGQELTENLNSINWLGKSDWKPMEIQAIGWMNLTKMTGAKGTSGDVASAFSRNTRRISMEVDPGEGSPWSMKYGKDYNDLADASKFEINNKVTAKAVELVNKKEGLNLTTTVHGTGGWELFQNASTVSQAISSRETAIKAAARLGHMLNQTEVWVNTSKEITKGVKHYGVDLLEDGSSNLRNSDTLKELFEAIIEKDTNGLFRGYQPIIVNGKPGIRIIIDDVAIKQSPLTKAQVQKYIQEFVGTNGGLNEILGNLNYDIKTAIHEVELTKLRNDWKEKPNGESYREYFGDKSGTTESSGVRSNIDIDGKELEDYFSKLIKEARG